MMAFHANRFAESDPLLLRIATLSAAADTIRAMGDDGLARDVQFTADLAQHLFRTGFDGLEKVLVTAEWRLKRRAERGPS